MSKEADMVLNKGLWLISDLMFYREKLGDQVGCLALSDEVYQTRMVSDPSRYESKVNSAITANNAQCEKTLNSSYVKAEKCPVVGYDTMFAIPSAWREQDELYYEIACLRFVENNKNERGMQRDAPKKASEGLSGIARLEVLYVEHVEKKDGSTWQDWFLSDESITWGQFYNEGWLSFYKLNELYFASEKGELFGGGYCYELTPKLGKKAGMIYFKGSSSPCNGGSARYLDRIIVQLDYPFKAQVIKAQKKSW